MTKIHIIYIPFTGVGSFYKPENFNQEKFDLWFKDRIEIFKNYTLKSLLNQTNKNFILWLSFRQEEAQNPFRKELTTIIKKFNIKGIMTFSGLMYFDDRNDQQNLTLETRLFQSLPWFSNFIDEKIDLIFLTRLDSDDMLGSMAVEHIQQGWAINVESLVFKKGYIYNKDRDELAEWHPETNPPFYTLIMDRETFLDPQKYLAFYKNFKSHEDITRQFTYLTLLDYQYCVVIYGQNLSTTWEHRFRGRIIENHQEILKEFGI